jgi:hypothetical protein
MVQTIFADVRSIVMMKLRFSRVMYMCLYLALLRSKGRGTILFLLRYVFYFGTVSLFSCETQNLHLTSPGYPVKKDRKRQIDHVTESKSKKHMKKQSSKDSNHRLGHGNDPSLQILQCVSEQFQQLAEMHERLVKSVEQQRQLTAQFQSNFLTLMGQMVSRE